MKRKHKRPASPARVETEEARALEYRLENLALICSRIEIRMSDSFVYEVWGQLRHAPRRMGLLRLAAVRHNLRAAVGQALVTAEALERPYLPTVAPESVAAVAARLSEEEMRAAITTLWGEAGNAQS